MAVQDLYPERFAALLSLRSVIDDAERSRLAHQWVADNRLACRAVETAAHDIADGQDEPGETATATVWVDENRQVVKPPDPIQAMPRNETLEEFVERAREQYHRMRQWLQERGVKPRPVKRELDHFRYLAAHVIGGASWAQIARGDTGLSLPRKDQKTVAGEARKAAAMVGLPLRATRGPRPGSKLPRRRRRPRRP